MKKIIFFLSAAGLVIISAFAFKSENQKALISADEIKAGTYKVDIESSTVGWEGKKIAYGHNGTVDLSGGELTFDNDGLKGGSFELDMQTIKNLDIKEPKKNNKLVGHLKSQDFFDVEKHPKATFKITEVAQVKDGENNYKITGNLTIKEITHPLTFAAAVKEDGGVIKANAKLTFDRSKYNVKFQSGSFFENLGDKVIYDDISMEVSLVAKK